MPKMARKKKSEAKAPIYRKSEREGPGLAAMADRI